jgi:hypothetical protein
MWRRFVGLDAQTRAEKRASLNGLSLFFGALIGANLGSIEVLPVGDYMLIVTIVCVIAIYIHVAPVARNRWTAIAALLATVGGLYIVMMTPFSDRIFDTGIRPKPHLFFTIALWLVSIVLIELRPVLDEDAAAQPQADR